MEGFTSVKIFVYWCCTLYYYFFYFILIIFCWTFFLLFTLFFFWGGRSRFLLFLFTFSPTFPRILFCILFFIFFLGWRPLLFFFIILFLFLFRIIFFILLLFGGAFVCDSLLFFLSAPLIFNFLRGRRWRWTFLLFFISFLRLISIFFCSIFFLFTSGGSSLRFLWRRTSGFESFSSLSSCSHLNLR